MSTSSSNHDREPRSRSGVSQLFPEGWDRPRLREDVLVELYKKRHILRRRRQQILRELSRLDAAAMQINSEIHDMEVDHDESHP